MPPASPCPIRFKERVLRALGRDLGQSRTRRWPQQPAELCNTVDFGDSAYPKDHSCGTRWEAAAHQSCSWDHPRAPKRIPGISIGTTPDFGKTTYSRFKSSIVKKLTSSVPVASSPISTRWQQAHVKSEAEQTFTECWPINLTPSDGSELTRTPEEITKIPVTSPMLIKTSATEPVINMNARYHKAYREDSQGRNKRPAESTNEQKCLTQILMVQEYGVSFPENGRMKICENMECIWEGCQDGIQNEFTLHRVSLDTEPFLPLEPEVRFHITGFRNDYYLNTLDWNRENLIAVALGSCAYIWNGETHQSIESIDLNSSAKYISSIAWIKEGTCLAVGTSDGEVQLWDIETKKRLRNMVGHLSVVGAMSWNHYILSSSGSRLGFVHHHDVRVAQHHVGTLCQNKQSICSLKWSLNNKLLASGSSDGILNIWPSDPGATVHCKPVQTMPHPSAVKAMNWCPWQSEILATGGGLKDGLLRVWDISSGKTIKTTETKSQICSLFWLPNTNELVTGHGLPKNQIKIWKYPMLANSVELFGHKGRVLHVALSPDCSRFISLAADGVACVWKYFQSSETRHRRDDIQGDYSRTLW
ncbi:cell division cycle protein 20 homolog B [Alligator sinensis]|uniref:Cell division cycle protein 20 homolog B n=1 Tax=Alligator sinensis TaxID=38654 RepID=A0A3Q0G1H9_ALLSI|nr:cell division cycle protein 20 homolog B [Alligator sinensis]